MKSFFKLVLAVALMSTIACSKKDEGGGALDDLDPRNKEQVAEMEQEALAEGVVEQLAIGEDTGCKRETCRLWILVDKATQTAQIFIDGELAYEWLVSTGAAGHGTPDFDKRPNGRIYNRYSSTKFPGGDYNGLGNMPYAMFIEGGFAIHGTTRGNFSKLGKRASHGCVRLHPDNAKILNETLRAIGVADAWITIQ